MKFNISALTKARLCDFVLYTNAFFMGASLGLGHWQNVVVTGLSALIYWHLGSSYRKQHKRDLEIAAMASELRDEQPEPIVLKKCPPHDWEFLPVSGHVCKICKSKAGEVK